MNKERFDAFQNAVDDAFLEEAVQYKRRGLRPVHWLSLAACLCLLISALSFWKPWKAAPKSEDILSTLTAMGYRFSVPAEATGVQYSLVEPDGVYPAPVAQVQYTLQNTAYTCRALQTPESLDISGQSEAWEQDLQWNQGDIQLRMCLSDTAGWIGWYVPEEGVQWCLSTKARGDSLLTNAMGIAKDLGFDLSTAPKGAEAITLRVFELDGMTVAETSFIFEGLAYVYRTAAAPLPELTDISGQDGAYSHTAAAMVSYCEGQLFLTQDGAGKLLWMDFVPGLVFSLSAEQGATEESLTQLANDIFVSIQGDSG